MKNILVCRRTFIATLAILTLGVINLYHGTDVALAISSVAIGLAGANAFEGSAKAKNGTKYSE